MTRLTVVAVLALVLTPLFSATSSAQDFSNSAPILIPSPERPGTCPPLCPATTATPYPSPIVVSGLAGSVADVNVTLRQLTHEAPSDLDVMLQGPNNQTVMLMSDDCEPDHEVNPITTPIDLTFDDSAAAPIPADTACGTGTFKPFDDDDDPEFTFTPVDSFPIGDPLSPAPAGSMNVSLSVFNGTTPNGTWNLWVVDDTPATPSATPTGQFANGWTLSITLAPVDSTTSTTIDPTTTSSTVDSTTTTSSTVTSTTSSTVTSTTSSTVAPTTSSTVTSTTSSTVAPTTTTSTTVAPTTTSSTVFSTTTTGGGSTTTSTVPRTTTTTGVPATTTSTVPATTSTTAQGGGSVTTTTAAGRSTTTSTAAGGSATTTTAEGGGTTTTVAGSGPTLRLSSTQVAAGDTVMVEGDRLPPDADFGLYLFSDPLLLANVRSSLSGGIRETVTIPANTALGAHQIAAVDSGGRTLATADLQVVRGTTTATTTVARTGGPLPRTGLRAQTLGLLALLSLLLGVLVLRSSELVRTQRAWPSRPGPHARGARRPRW